MKSVNNTEISRGCPVNHFNVVRHRNCTKKEAYVYPDAPEININFFIIYIMQVLLGNL